MNILKELTKLRKERAENAPFDSISEFEKWADNVHPLLSFNANYSREFSQAVTSATVTARMGDPIDSNTNMNNAVGVLNKAIVSAEIESKKAEESPKEVNVMETQSRSVKERFENHPVVFGGVLLIAGLLAGISIMKFMTPGTIISEKIVTAIPNVNVECNIEGLPALTERHDKRISVLHIKMLEFEAQASDRSIIPSYQDKYLESANRVRQDIKVENYSFNNAVSQLRAN